MWTRIPDDFNAISYALETFPALDDDERAELAASPWACAHDGAEILADAWHAQAGEQLLALAEGMQDPTTAVLASQVFGARANLLHDLAALARSRRFDVLAEPDRLGARALAVRSYVRALELELGAASLDA